MGNGRREKIKIEVVDKVEEREHFHQDIELLYILEGTMDVHVGEQVTHMQKEDILVVNANKKHFMNGSEDILYAQLMIEYPMISDVLKSVDVFFWCDSTKDENERYEDLRKMLKHLLDHHLSIQGNTANFGHISLCYRIVDILSMYFLVQSADREMTDDTEKFDDRINQINNYIRANYNQPISLKELAEQLYLSNGYLSRFFKKDYGMSFAEYLTNIRLFHAVDDLMYSNTPITRIAYDNGFASVAVFNKVFKNTYGETPSAFRKKSQTGKAVSEELDYSSEVHHRLEKYLESYGEKESEEQMDVVMNEGSCSVKETELLYNFWGRTINIGSASELLRSEIREHVILLKEALGFEYVRFWNIYSTDLFINIEENGEYNFTRLDAILDFLVELGLKPHIELGQKPSIIMYNVQKMQIQQGTRNIDFFQKESWEKLLRNLMRHVVNRYGRSEVDTWRLELWFNENKWDAKGSFETYYELFDILYETAKSYSEKIEVGGCGLRLDFASKKRKQFYREWMHRRVQPDFISIIQFPYDRGEEKRDIYSKRSTDNECMKHRILKEKEILKDVGASGIPLYITEWNLTISDRNYMNDSCFRGAYIIKNIFDVYDSVNDMSCFIGSDRASEYFDSKQLLFGGAGLMAKDGILKPAGFAFDFLRRLYPYCMGRGEHYLVSTDRHDSYGVLCHNQRPLGYNYFFTKEDELEREHLWKYFENRDSLQLKLTLKDVGDGLYQIKYHRINQKNGSMMEIWKELGYDDELSRNDIKYFRRICEPKLMIEKVEVKNYILNLDLNLQANEIVFVRIRKLL